MTSYAAAPGYGLGYMALHAMRFALLLPLLLGLGLLRLRARLGSASGLWAVFALAGILWMGKQGSNTNILFEAAAAAFLAGAPVV